MAPYALTAQAGAVRALKSAPPFAAAYAHGGIGYGTRERVPLYLAF